MYCCHDTLLPPLFVQNVSHKDNPRVFLDVSFNGGPPEGMVIELFANIVPKTAENFRALCTGELGKGKNTKRPLHYKGTVFHHIHKGFVAEGGDISEEQDGSGGESIYGGFFKDENHQLRHSEPGMLSMASDGSDNNGSRFYITFRSSGFLDGCHVVFGKVIKGMSTLCHIQEFGAPGGKPLGVVKIIDCGQISEDKGKKKKSLKEASSSDGLAKEVSDERKKGRKHSSSEDKKKNVMESDQGKKRKSLKRASSSDVLAKEVSDGRKKRRKHSSSEDKKKNVMKSDHARKKKKKALKKASSSDGRVKEGSDERKKRWKESSSEGLSEQTET